jgi:hypothetical protein
LYSIIELKDGLNAVRIAASVNESAKSLVISDCVGSEVILPIGAAAKAGQDVRMKPRVRMANFFGNLRLIFILPPGTLTQI